MSQTTFSLPTEYSEPTRVAPGIMLLYGNYKIGKTYISTQLPNHMILSLEARSIDYYKARAKQINGPSDFNKALNFIETNDVFYDYLVVDTITKLDEWAEWVGTYNYMKSPQGKKFNRPGEDPTATAYQMGDTNFQSVHTLGEGYGYRWSREVMMAWFKRFEKLIATGKVKHIVLIAHVKDKLIPTKQGDTVMSLDLNLTGRVKSGYAANSDAVGYMYAKKNERFISFKSTSNEKILSGNRSTYLSDQTIKISESEEDGTIKTYWEEIYPDLKE